MKDRLTDFQQISVLLTGVENLSPRLSESFLLFLTEKESNAIENMIFLFRQTTHEEFLQKVLADKTHAGLMRAIIKLWYCGEYVNLDAKVQLIHSPEAYYDGLMWATIQAHPVGLTGGYFGYWKYPPEN